MSDPADPIDPTDDPNSPLYEGDDDDMPDVSLPPALIAAAEFTPEEMAAMGLDPDGQPLPPTA